MRNVYKILPLLLFTAFSVKMIVYTPSIADGVILSILAGLIGFLEYKTSESRYNELRAQLAKLEQEQAQTLKSHTELKSFVQAMNLNANFGRINKPKIG